ncbi:MAG: T9SS type A sorting domain-containing protein, partial [Ignavibacteriaceae bacterium]
WYRNVNSQYVIIGQFLNPNGEKIDSNFVIIDASNSSRYSPAIASDTSGNFVVTWYDYRNNYAQVYGQKFVNDTISGTNFKISEDQLTSSKSYVSCGMNAGDYLVSTWLDYGDPTEYRLYSRLFDSSDQAVAPSTRVDTDSLSSSETNPTLAVMNDGSFIVIWTDKRERTLTTYFQRYDAEGNLLGTNVSNDDHYSQYDPKIALLKDGNFLLVWREYLRNIYSQYEVLGQKYFKTGEKIGDTFLISSIDRKGNANDPDVCSNSNGEFVVTWQKQYGSIYSIVTEKFDNDGNVVKNNFLVTDDTTSYKYRPKAGIDSLGNFAIAYYSYKNNNYDIFLHRFNSSGVELDSAIVVNDDKNHSTQYYPDISVNPAGDCIVAWYDYRTPNGVYFQKYKNIGSTDSFEKVDSNMAVADYDISNCKPSVSLQDNGEFVISWTEWNGSLTGSFNNLKFRIFNSGLTPLTDVMNATASQERNQINQDIVYKDNKIFNVWQDNHEHGVGYDIWANVYNFNYLVTGVNNKKINTPISFKLSQNYPNPFNPTTTIQYSVPSVETGHPPSLRQVELKVYDILGREVATLVNQRQNPGQYQVTFNAGNLASGTYFYRLRTGDFVQVKKMLLLK